MSTVSPRLGNPAVVKYRVTATNGSSEHTCFVEAGETPLSCWMADLEPATEYSVSAVGCLPNNAGCGPETSTHTATYPSGTFGLVKVYAFRNYSYTILRTGKSCSKVEPPEPL